MIHSLLTANRGDGRHRSKPTVEGFGYREVSDMLELPIAPFRDVWFGGIRRCCKCLAGLLMVENVEFFAWLDGELPPEEAACVAAEVAADPERARCRLRAAVFAGNSSVDRLSRPVTYPV
jgi:hypothetical protein